MNKCFNKSVNHILSVAEKEMFSCHHPYVGSEHLLLALLKCNKVSKICNKYNLDYKNFKESLLRIIGMASKKSEIILYTPLLKIIINKALDMASKDNKEIDEIYLLSSLLNEQDGIALRIVDNMGIDTEAIIKEINKPRLLYEYGINLNDSKKDAIYLRDKEVNSIIEILLRKNKNNPILIGKAGVGKTSVVSELARRIKIGKVPDKLKNYEIIELNTSTLIAGTKYRGEFEERINNIIKEIKKSSNIILFIDEIHTIVKTGSSDGSIDAANILKPYLTKGGIKIIGATTTNEYYEYIKRDKAFSRRFTPVLIEEPSLNDMKYILRKIKKSFEEYYDLKIDNKVLDYIIKINDKYYKDLCNPDKSIELLDTACSKKVLKGEDKILKIEDIDVVIKPKEINPLGFNRLLFNS